MLTASNRFVRDRATKALVSLLSENINVLIEVLSKFDSVNDPYVSQRLYAVAYGCSLRNGKIDELSDLAGSVFKSIFAEGSPPPDILLRDYARGVVEYALHLGWESEIDSDSIAPPYSSPEPIFPTNRDIDELRPSEAVVPYDHEDWAHHRIIWSTEMDDFASYVIGSAGSWLSARLDQPPWISTQGRQEAILENLAPEEREAWDAVVAAERNLLIYDRTSWPREKRSKKDQEEQTNETEDGDADASSTLVEGLDEDVENQLSESVEKARAQLEATVPHEVLDALERLSWPNRVNDAEPEFDRAKIQRYVIWRVFDLGGTTEKFGSFDKDELGYSGRVANKAERIGKKYQWIAYHEVLALIADHFQFRERLSSDSSAKTYRGPWQLYRRDIDPSCLLLSGSELDDREEWMGWLQTPRPRLWTDANGRAESTEDLVDVPDLLVSTGPRTNETWLNVYCHADWTGRPLWTLKRTKSTARIFGYWLKHTW